VIHLGIVQNLLNEEFSPCLKDPGNWNIQDQSGIVKIR